MGILVGHAVRLRARIPKDFAVRDASACKLAYVAVHIADESLVYQLAGKTSGILPAHSVADAEEQTIPRGAFFNDKAVLVVFPDLAAIR